MTRAVLWSERAINAAAGFLSDDGPGLRQLLAAVDQLADDPQPASSVQYGSPALRRLRAGRYRVLYEISDVITSSMSGGWAERRQGLCWGRRRS